MGAGWRGAGGSARAVQAARGPRAKQERTEADTGVGAKCGGCRRVTAPGLPCAAGG